MARPAHPVFVIMAVVAPTLPDDAEAAWRRRTLVGRALNFCRRKPLGTIGLVIVVVFAIAGIFAEWIAPFDPEENDFTSMMFAPNLTHWLGTDQFGRDIFSRLVFGARTAMIVGFGAAVGGGIIGLVLGVTSAYFGGWFDLVLQRIFDILMAFPLIILALAVVSVFGTGVFNVVVAILFGDALRDAIDPKLRDR
jgi:peptide/nickel transport system permease protein